MGTRQAPPPIRSQDRGFCFVVATRGASRPHPRAPDPVCSGLPSPCPLSGHSVLISSRDVSIRAPTFPGVMATQDRGRKPGGQGSHAWPGQLPGSSGFKWAQQQGPFLPGPREGGRGETGRGHALVEASWGSGACPLVPQP